MWTSFCRLLPLDPMFERLRDSAKLMNILYSVGDYRKKNCKYSRQEKINFNLIMNIYVCST
jgi:hypothetical protein